MKDKISLSVLKNLTVKKLKEEVNEIKNQLPKTEQKVITFSKNFTLSISNYCVNQCGYCFYNFKIPKKESNITLLEDYQIKNLIQKAIQYNCKEALLMSGERPDNFQEVKTELERRDFKDYIEFIIDISTRLLKFNILPHTNLGVLTFNELKRLKNYNASIGLMLESTSLELFKKGAVHELSPGKLPERRIEHIENAGKLKIPFTTGLLLGIGETFEDRIRDLCLIKEIYAKYEHIQEVIIQNFTYKEGISYHPVKQITIEEMLKTVGIAKLILQNDISVQVPPNLISGFEKDFIEVGVDDFGGISPLTRDYINPESPWPLINELKRICEHQGYKLKERLPVYDKFINKNGFCPESIKKKLDNIIIDEN